MTMQAGSNAGPDLNDDAAGSNAGPDLNDDAG